MTYKYKQSDRLQSRIFFVKVALSAEASRCEGLAGDQAGWLAGSGEVVAVLNPGHHGGHQLLQLLRSLLADLQDLLVVGLLLALVVHHRLVGDERERKGAHAAVARDDDLVRGAHACRTEERG